MDTDKKFSAKEAAIAVLKKAEEMLKSSTLAKSNKFYHPKDENPLDTSLLSNTKQKSVPKKDPVPIDTSLLSNTKKSKLAKVEVHIHEKNSDMDHGQKRGPEGYPKYQEQAQNQKGVHTPVSGVTVFPGGKGSSEAGNMATETWDGKPNRELRDHGKELHRKKLSEMQAQPKPNLPKAEGTENTDQEIEGQPSPEDNPHEQKEGNNPEWGAEAGIYKLAKFCGHMGAKRKMKKPAPEMDKAETGHEKGINTSTDPKQRSRVMMGTSVAGRTLPSKHKEDHEEAKGVHRKVLADMKAQPKPNLTKSEEKGVHTQNKAASQGRSSAGVEARFAAGVKADKGAGKFMQDVAGKKVENAKKIHSDKLAELKAMPKPNLTKSVTRDEHEKGVHNVLPKYEKGKGVTHGSSHAGLLVAGAHRDAEKPKLKDYNTMKISTAKKQHTEKLAELKAMPKPNLTKKEGK